MPTQKAENYANGKNKSREFIPKVKFARKSSGMEEIYAWISMKVLCE